MALIKTTIDGKEIEVERQLASEPPVVLGYGAEVQQAVAWFAANRPEESTLERLPYNIAQALEEGRMERR